MASLRILPSGKYNFQIRHKDQRPISKTFNTKKEAEKFIKEVKKGGGWPMNSAQSSNPGRSDFGQAIHLGCPQITLREALKRYQREISINKKSFKPESYRISRLMDSSLGNQLLHEIRPVHIAHYRDQRLINVTNDSINRELALLSHLFNIARIEWGMSESIKENPVSLVRKPKANRARDRRINEDELEQILNAVQDGPKSFAIRLVIELAFLTSMRRSELLSIQYENIDWANRTVLLPDTKNGDSRVVPLSSKAIELLRQATESLPSNAAVVFEINAEHLSQTFARAAAKAKIHGVRFHNLRHSAVSSFVEMGLSIPEVSAISGHKSWSMLKRYTHLKPAQIALKLG